MESWEGLYVPDKVLESLEGLGFNEPTTIQRLVLPAAIRDRKDILGAAETGSGKTLAFGIPIIQKILEIKAFERERSERSEAAMDCDTVDNEDDEELDELSEDDGNSGGFDQPPDEEDLLYTWQDGDIEPDLSLMIEEIDNVKDEVKSKKDKVNNNESKLYALILTPTRELAIQVKQHIEAVAASSNLKVGIVIGGMSAQKQARILSKRPEIVVATPGRFWDFVQEGNEHLRDAAAVPLLVLDEADRLLESGHFAEVRSFLERVRVTPVTVGDKKRRQTFVFSATLTFIHATPKRKMKKKIKRNKQLSAQDRVDFFMQALGLTERRPHIVDCTQQIKSLTEAYLLNSGDPAERDLQLTWLIRSYSGRSLVFCNSKNTSRRLVNVLRLMKCRSPLALHADMHQKARLKNLERFVADSQGLLVASDVAARGLDIPHVQHVIHYQPPKTAETYVHRSGRTARANRDGRSVALLGPDELPDFRRLLWNINKNVGDLDQLTPDSEELKQLRRVVDLARDIEAMEHRQSRSQGNEDWFEKAAREADLAWGSDSSQSDDDERVHRAKQANTRKEKAALSGMRRGLQQLLDEIDAQQTKETSSLKNRLALPRFPGQATTYERLLMEQQQSSDKKLSKTDAKKKDIKQAKKQRLKNVRRLSKRNVDQAISQEDRNPSTIGSKKLAKRLGRKVGKLLKPSYVELV